MTSPRQESCKSAGMARRKKQNRKIRYAVAGLGHIAQVAVLPAFEHAENSELAAIISGDPVKHEELGERYGLDSTYSYDQYEDCLEQERIDAVYIALPNHMHREFTERAARAGVHVLCEKPMAVTEEDCRAMIRACKDANVKLMIAYRLHFEEGNLEAVRIATSGRLGEVRFFESSFAQQVVMGNIRVEYPLEQGGGPLYDMGIYCLNAARYLFRDEPILVSAFSANTGERRFQNVDDTVSAVLKFPEGRLASFTCSFGAVDVSTFTLVGTKGWLRADPAYDYTTDIKLEISVNDKRKQRTFSRRDQFAPELIYFSQCVIEDREPEPSGAEGLADVRVIEAIHRSVAEARPIALDRYDKLERPERDQEIRRPPVEKPDVVNAEAASGDE
jgi:glucose-fructose oxidoreductase